MTYTIRGAMGGVLILAAAMASIAHGAEQRQKPNIVLFMADDFGYECVTANGGESYATPNLIDSVDFLTSLRDAVGAPLPESLRIDGQSFLPRFSAIPAPKSPGEGRSRRTRPLT